MDGPAIPTPLLRRDHLGRLRRAPSSRLRRFLSEVSIDEPARPPAGGRAGHRGPWASPSPSTRTAPTSTGRGPSTCCPGSITTEEWHGVAAGLEQRLRALNLLHRRHLRRPEDPRRRRRSPAPHRASPNFRPGVPRRAPAASACGPTSAAATWSATRDGTFYVLEDNLRVPSGRVATCWRTAWSPSGCSPSCSATIDIHPVDGYPDALLRAAGVARPGGRGPTRRAHARRVQLGLLRARLPRPADGRRAGRGQDLVVDDDDIVYMRTIDGPAGST